MCSNDLIMPGGSDSKEAGPARDEHLRLLK